MRRRGGEGKIERVPEWFKPPPPPPPPHLFCILHSVRVASWHFMVSTQAYDASLPDEGDLLLPRLIMIIVMMITIITNFPCRSRPACCLRGRNISCSCTLCGDAVVAWGVCLCMCVLKRRESMFSVCVYMCVAIYVCVYVHVCQCAYFYLPPTISCRLQACLSLAARPAVSPPLTSDYGWSGSSTTPLSAKLRADHWAWQKADRTLVHWLNCNIWIPTIGFAFAKVHRCSKAFCQS